MKQAAGAAALAVAAVFLSTGISAAQSLPAGFTLKGRAQADFLFDNGRSSDFQFLDLTFGATPAATGGPVGFEVGVKGFRGGKADFSESLIFATVSYETGFGKFSAGIPRPATSDFFELPRVAGTNIFGALAGVGLTTTEGTAMFGNQNYVGVRYDYGFANGLKFAASYHDFTDSRTSTFAAAMGYDDGTYDAAFGLEYIDTTGGTDMTYSARFGYDAGQWGAGGMFSEAGIIDTRTLAIDAFYRPMDKVTLSAAWAHFDSKSKGDSSAFGVSAEYAFWEGAYVGAGLADSDVPAFDVNANVYLGWKFDY